MYSGAREKSANFVKIGVCIISGGLLKTNAVVGMWVQARATKRDKGVEVSNKSKHNVTYFKDSP